MISKGLGKQSKRYECQLLHKANTVGRNPGMTTDDVCLMFTWALKIAPGFPIHGGNKIKANARGFSVVSTITECWHTNLGMCGMYNSAEACRSNKNPLPIAESRTWKPAMVTLKIQLDCSTVHDTTLWVNIFVGTHWGCGTDSVSSVFCRSHKYFKDAKALQINRILEIS